MFVASPKTVTPQNSSCCDVRPRWHATAAAAAAIAALLTGCQPNPFTTVGAAGHPAAVSSPAAAADAATTARVRLRKLVVRADGSMAGYSRSTFGPAWPTIDGCDARQRALRRDLTHVVLRAGGCIVQAGTLVDPYTGAVMSFRRGPASVDFPVDHVVSLADAYRTGARAWTPARREAFANNLAELLVIDKASNERKADLSAAGYLPVRAFQCRFAEIQIGVKVAFRLTVTAAERLALNHALGTCPPRPAQGTRS